MANRADEVLDLRPGALLLRVTNFGTDHVGGGTYERPFLMTWVFGADGMVTRVEQFDVGHEAEALARFDELVVSSDQPRRTEGATTPSLALRIENAATRTFARALEALRAQDWERFAALFAPGFRGIDRRTMLQNELDRDEWLVSYRPIVEMTSSRSTNEVLATRGDRLVLARYGWEGTDGLVGPSEIEYLLLIEVDGCGDHVAVVMFDPDALDAARAELDRRYAAAEAAAHGRVAAGMGAFVRAIASRDWDAMPALFSPDLVVNDHRPLGWETLHGPATYVESLKSLVDIAPDVRLRGDHMSFSDRAALVVDAWVGTREGGAFEAPRAVVFEFDVPGRIRSLDLYNPEQLDEARTRFEAVGATSAPDPLRIPPNAAWRARERFHGLARARDWEGSRALATTDFTYEDRRKHALVTGDVEVWIRSAREATSWPRLRVSGALIGTAGDRIMVERVAWTGGHDAGAFEIDLIRLVEVAADGRLVAWIDFDVEDRSAASAEATARFLAGEAAAARAGLAPIAALERAWGRHDWDAMRDHFAPDAVVDDHRTLGMGRLDRDRWIESWRVGGDLAPDVRAETLRILAWNRQWSRLGDPCVRHHPGRRPFRERLLPRAWPRAIASGTTNSSTSATPTGRSAASRSCAPNSRSPPCRGLCIPGGLG
jgi:hypothetical protein